MADAWKKVKLDVLYKVVCPNCKYVTDVHKSHLYNYCPSCGIKKTNADEVFDIDTYENISIKKFIELIQNDESN